MATTGAAAYVCCSAALLPFAAFPGSISPFRAPPRPTRVSLVGSLKLRAPAPGLRVSFHRRRQPISACSSGEVSSDTAALPTCAGCQVYHKFVDNLGLVVEYDLREENGKQEGNMVNTDSKD